ncbi:hypothetical protein SSRG_03970 [Streptomyces griseoflavus Tu4000]|uniref:Uncharacterized protein n=1 Tax=Streptomyces griseoflavus Tu4000 TaxID=467200 RepID=D9XY66_9ACTN|nr:hypothetical protein SSRG_03970 [Streptomyces griseoflavus Tu4000]
MGRTPLLRPRPQRPRGERPGPPPLTGAPPDEGVPRRGCRSAPPVGHRPGRERHGPPPPPNTAGQAPTFFASGCDPANAATYATESAPAAFPPARSRHCCAAAAPAAARTTPPSCRFRVQRATPSPRRVRSLPPPNWEPSPSPPPPAAVPPGHGIVRTPRLTLPGAAPATRPAARHMRAKNGTCVRRTGALE